jgi:hypothetical protein
MQLARSTVNRLVLGLGVTLALASCTKEQPRQAPQAAPNPAATAPPPGPGVAAPQAAEPGQDSVSGTVVETMSSGGYTYAKLDEGGKQVWAAGPETALAVGAKIGKVSGMLMTGFRSTTLNRTFDQIYFVSSFDVTGGAAPNPHGAGAAAGGAMPNPHGAGPAAGGAMPNPHGAGPAAGTGQADKIAPAPGGKTVAEIFAGKDALAGKPVVVHGKVVKVNNGILGHNWVHLQDGTGAAGTNDLMVTTSATVAKGDVVVARGTIAINKDFGAGYTYAVLVEDATIVSKEPAAPGAAGAPATGW